jgi:hypothetical protein
MSQIKQNEFSEIRNYHDISRDKYIEILRYATGITNFQPRFDSIVLAKVDSILTITFESGKSEDKGTLVIKHRNPDKRQRDDTLNDLEKRVLGRN